MSNGSYEGPERIAIVGMACRFPGAADVDGFWRNLRDGVESIGFFGDDALRDAGVPAAVRAHPEFVPAFGALEGADLFDADFFDFNPREAELMDPQHRLFLEQAWAALEHAGCDPETFPGPIGVFAGTNLNTYLLTRLSALDGGGGDALVNRIRSDKDFLATLVSYKLNLRGPSLSVQTACSTGLVAVHLACQSLLDYHCDAALAGGVSVHVPLTPGYVSSPGVNSRDGHCRAFDEQADGMVPGSGVGVVVLKRLSDALAGGDRIHAVILGTAVNNDGAQKVGFTAPSVDGQIEVVALAHAVAGVEAESIGYVEAHGTATPLGDPVELAALTRAFDTAERGFCGLGSVKTNIGHTDAASGIAGLIKTALALREAQIPPSLHFERANPALELDRSPFFVVDRLRPWPARGGPRRAGVSAFGVGGTNGHVVLEEAPAATETGVDADAGDAELLVLSARTPRALDALAAATAAHLEQDDAPLADVAFTLARGRKAFPHRRALVARDGAEAAALLRGGDPSRVTTHAAAEADPGVAFLFSGLGTQYAGMSRGLYEAEPAFREAMDRCFAVLRGGWGMDLASVLYPADAPAGDGAGGIDFRALVRGGGGPSESDPLQGARWGHPAVFAVGYALAELWKDRGIEPRAVAGHSLGEYVAACVAGVFTLEDALTLVVRRAALLDSIPGSMAAVSLSEAETRALVDDLASSGDAPWLAAVNAPRSCVVSGSAEGVARFSERAKAEGALVLPLAVRHPFHSGMLASVREEFARVVASIRRKAPAIPLAANATGEWLRPEQAQSVEYWVDHLLNPVRFAGCVDTLRGLGGGASGEPVLLEVGPGSVLGSWARQQGAARVAASLRHAEQPGDDRTILLRAVGQLWAQGVAVDWTRQGMEGRRRVVLPGHPLQRRRFWLEAETPSAAPDADERRPLRDWFHAPLWKQTPALDAPADALGGRRIVVFGGAAAAPLCGRMRAAGADVVRVEGGDGFRDGEACVTLRPGDAGDYAALARALAGRGWAGETHTLHLWSLDDAGAEVSIHDVRVGLANGMHALLHWVRAAGGAGLLEAGSTLLGATRGAQAVLGNEELRPWQAAVAAVVKVAGQEHAGVRGRSVDVDARGWEDAVLAEAADLLAGGDGEADVAYRGRGRWTPFHAPMAADARADGRVRLREGGVYVVAGGLRGDGLAIARHLAEHAPGARLVLTARRGLPPREGWDAWLAEHGPADAVSRRIASVRGLEALGAEVRVASANVTDPAAMRAVVQDAVAAWGGVHGVVHAIGAASGGFMADETPETLSMGQAASVAGALALDAATEGMALDFFVLSSSLHAAHGGAGELGRTAAGAFLDAFASWRGWRDGRHVVSIAWDGWSDGDGADSGGISPEEGAEAFGRVLAHGFAPRVAVSTRDLPARIERARRAVGTADAAPEGGRRTAHPRPAGMPPFVEPRTELERELARLYRTALGVEPVGADDHFFDLGGDSLLATQLLTALNETYRVQLPLRDLFEAATPARLAVAIVQKQAELIDDDLLAQVLAEL